MVLRVAQGDGKFSVEADGSVRVAQGDAKFSVEADGSVRVAQGIGKFAIETADAAAVRVAQGVAKYAVRLYPVMNHAPQPPPVDTAFSQAPFIRYRRG